MLGAKTEGMGEGSVPGKPHRVLIIYIITQNNNRGWQGIFGGDGYAYGIDCGDGFTVYTYLQAHQAVCIKYVQLSVYQKQNKTKKHINE